MALPTTLVWDGKGESAPFDQVLAKWRPESSASLVIFLRHFGCFGCTLQVRELLQMTDQLERLGVRTLLVGNGAYTFIPDFVERNGLNRPEIKVVTEPTLAIYKQFELERLKSVVNLRLAAEFIKAAVVSGVVQTSVQGDRLQLGGALVLDSRGEIVYRHQAESIGDLVRSADLLPAIFKAVMKKQGPQA